MKRKGFTRPGYEFRKWEQTGNVCVHATKGVALSNVGTTMCIINLLIDQFKLPLRTINGNLSKSEDARVIDNLMAKNTQANSIDCQSILETLRGGWNHGAPRDWLVVLVEANRYEFRNDPGDPEPAIYGWTDNQGLSVLRRFDNQNVVRHEFGHMIGLGRHHPGCAMDWSCEIHEFCESCERDVAETWKRLPACVAGESVKPGA